jgi:hypothetical protein
MREENLDDITHQQLDWYKEGYSYKKYTWKRDKLLKKYENYYINHFKESIWTKSTSLFIAISLILASAIIEGVGIFLLILNYSSIPQLLLYSMIILLPLLYLLSIFLLRYQPRSEFTMIKWIIFFILFFQIFPIIILAVPPTAFVPYLIPLFLFLENIIFGCVIGIYVFANRITGAGEAHRAAVAFRYWCNNESKGANFEKNFKSFIKGIDDWCSEKANMRIKNLDDWKNQWLLDVLLNFSAFKEKMVEKFFNREFFLLIIEKSEEKETLVTILRKVSELFPKINLGLERETIKYKITRNLGNLGIIPTTYGVISSLIGVILPFIHF